MWVYMSVPDCASIYVHVWVLVYKSGPDVQVYIDACGCGCICLCLMCKYIRTCVCVGVSVNGRWGAYDVMQINLDCKFNHPSFILINYQNKEYGDNVN